MSSPDDLMIVFYCTNIDCEARFAVDLVDSEIFIIKCPVCGHDHPRIAGQYEVIEKDGFNAQFLDSIGLFTEDRGESK